MSPHARRQPWQGITLAVLLALWIGLAWLLVISRGNPETFLRAVFAGSSRPDAFHALNRILIGFWVVHSCLLLAALSAIGFRRSDVLVVLLMGPVLGLGFGVSSQHWGDPNWVVFVGVCQLGWLAGMLVGLVYWGVRPVARSA